MLDSLTSRRGFSLLEVLIAVVVASILLAIAVPRSLSFTNNYELQVAAEQLAGDLQRTRLDATRLNTTVTFTRTGLKTYQIGGIAVNTLFGGATFSAGDPASLQFSSFGRLVGAPAQFQVQGAHGGTKVVRVAQGGATSIQ